jgi:hypothetical protein
MKILTEYHGHSSADAHEYVSSKACRAVLFGAVDTDYSAAQNCDAHTDQQLPNREKGHFSLSPQRIYISVYRSF